MDERPMPNPPLQGYERIPPLRCSRTGRFVNRANDYARDDHLDKAADAYEHEKLCWKWLCRIKRATRANRQNLQHDSETNTRRDSAPGKTAGVNHDERQRQPCLTDDNPVKQT